MFCIFVKEELISQTISGDLLLSETENSFRGEFGIPNLDLLI